MIQLDCKIKKERRNLTNENNTNTNRTNEFKHGRHTLN